MSENFRTFPWKLALVAAAAVLLTMNRPAPAQQDFWPKKLQHPKGTIIMYQPQLADFEGNYLKGIAAISAQAKGMKQPVFGAVWLEGRVSADRDSRMATIDRVKILEVKFPEAKPEELEKVKELLDAEVADWSIPISLDRLVAAMDLLEKKWAGEQGLRNDPPKIFFRTEPAVLVPLDGDPRLIPIPDSRIMQVINTPFTMLFDPVAKAYYLWGGDDWLSAAEVAGPWKELATLPEELKALVAKIEAKVAESARQRGLEPPSPERQKREGPLPEIIVSTVPAELLVTEGAPQFSRIAGTGLMFANNTEDNLFLDTATQDYYVLISGRWFKTRSLTDGPFAYVAPDQLPADFAKIPPDSPKGFVLASVAGTVQAREAVLDAQIPQTAVIDRHRATLTVTYAGEPQFDKIPGTDLEYAVNTATSVFKKGTRFFALEEGVWYEADSPTGPWQVATATPPFLDQIPPSNPHYTARFVRVFDATDDTVTVGYTPGYTGSFVDRGTVVFGTGFNYQPFAAETVFIPFQATYGYAAVFDPYVGSWGFQPSYYRPDRWLAPGLVGYGLGLLTGRAIWGRDYYGWGWWGRGRYYRTNINITHNHINRRPWNPGNRWPGDRPGDGWWDDRWRDRDRDRWRDRDRDRWADRDRDRWRDRDRDRGDRWRDRDRDRDRGDRWRDRDRDRWTGGRPGDRRPPRPDGDNIYNRPWNRGNLASRPGERPGLRPDRPGERPTALPERPAVRPDRPAERPAVRPERPAERPAMRPDRPGVRPDRPDDRVATRPDRPGDRPAARPERPVERPAVRPERPAERPGVRPDRPQTQIRPGGGRNNVVADRDGNVFRQDQRGNLQQRRGNQWVGVGQERPGSRPEARPARPGSRPEVSRPAGRPGGDTGRVNRELQARQRGDARTQNFQRRQSSPAGRGGGVSRPSGGGRGGNVSRPSGGGGRGGGVSRPSGGGGGRPGGGGGRPGGGGGGRP